MSMGSIADKRVEFIRMKGPKVKKNKENYSFDSKLNFELRL